MGCTLNKFKTYNVGQVRFDRGTGSYTVQLTDRLEKCPDGTFSSRKAKLQVQAGAPPSLAFDTAKNVPVITVPNEGFVINYGDAGLGFGSFLLLALGLGAVYVIVRSLMKKASAPVSYASASAPAYSQTANAPQQGGGTTVVNNNSGPDLLTTVLVADMLSNHNHGGSNNTTIIERERVVEREAPSRDDSFSSDSSDSDEVSSDNDSSSDFSSDSGSSNDSFSSDSNDSSSDYSSDSSSDSSGGGSDFSSDN